jgi:hypothetical protein
MDFRQRGKSMGFGIRVREILSVCCLSLVIFFFLSGCGYRLTQGKSLPLQVDLREYQPVALLPVQDFTNHPEPTAQLYAIIYDSLRAKGYALIEPSAVSEALFDLNLSVQNINADPAALARFTDQVKARLLMFGTLLEYEDQKPNISSRTYQVWDGLVYEYSTLPTYDRGLSRMRLQIKLVDPKKNATVWMSEVTGSGPSRTDEKQGKTLVQNLLESLPATPPPQSPPAGQK